MNRNLVIALERIGVEANTLYAKIDDGDIEAHPAVQDRVSDIIDKVNEALKIARDS